MLFFDSLFLFFIKIAGEWLLLRMLFLDLNSQLSLSLFLKAFRRRHLHILDPLAHLRGLLPELKHIKVAVVSLTIEL